MILLLIPLYISGYQGRPPWPAAKKLVIILSKAEFDYSILSPFDNCGPCGNFFI